MKNIIKYVRTSMSSKNAVSLTRKTLVAISLFTTSISVAGAGWNFYQYFSNPKGKYTRRFDVCSIQEPCTPKTVEDLQALVKKAHEKERKVCVVGAGKSMGGQTICDSSCAYQVSLSKLNQLIGLNIDDKEVTVQTGMTWRQLQEHIAPHKLAIKAMQSYNDFSVGGSLAVNVHGQDRTAGQIIKTVKSFKLITPKGELLTVSRTENSKLFGAAIGGYGLFGIIAEVTLQLTDDVLLKRHEQWVKTEQLADYFLNKIKDNPAVEFYSARFHLGSSDLLEKAYILTYEQVEDPTASKTHFNLLPPETNYLYRGMLWLLKTFPSLKNIRPTLAKHYFKSLYPNEYISRNNFMNSSIRGLPRNTPLSQYILQEYFIPYEKLTAFLKGLKSLIKKYEVNIINISARHVHADNESLLTFAPREACSLVLYICTPPNEAAYKKVTSWTQETIDHAIACNGRFYLPYQLLAKRKQLEQAYPTWQTFMALKKEYDPQVTFCNKLYEVYA